MQREDELKEKSSSPDCDKTRTITKNCREKQESGGGNGDYWFHYNISPLTYHQFQVSPGFQFSWPQIGIYRVSIQKKSFRIVLEALEASY